MQTINLPPVKEIDPDNFQIFSIPLQATHVAIYKNSLLAKCKNAIKIFSFDSKMSLKLQRVHQLCFTSSLSQYFPDVTVSFAYKVMLGMVEGNIPFKEAEEYLCKLLERINMSRATRIRRSGGFILFEYADGEKRIFDSELKEIPKEMESPVVEDVSVEKSGHSIVVKLNNETILKRKFGRARKVLFDDNFVFVILEDSIVVIVFS